MAQSIYGLLGNCTVSVTTGPSKGTGFFVAPGLVLTCAHVVAPSQQASAPIQVSWQGQSFSATLTQAREASDLALLKVDIPNQSCVLLAGSADPFSDLYSYGFPDTEPAGTPSTFQCVGWLGPANELIKFKEGQVRPGMSGSPLLNKDTGSVCGIVQITYDRSSYAAGGKGLLTQAIYREFPELAAAQQSFHARDHSWPDLLSQEQRQKLQLNWLPGPAVPDKLQVFVSYSQKDEALKEEFDDAVVMLRRNNLIESWSDKDITADQEKDAEVQKHLNTANIIILLVSNSFLASNDLYETEMTRAMERHETGTARIVPIILRQCEWRDTPFGKLLGLPRNGKPIASWNNRDEAFYEVAKELRRVVEDLKKTPTASYSLTHKYLNL